MNQIITLGPKGTYSDLAAFKVNNKVTQLYTKSLLDICPQVLKNPDNFGIMPVENSATGMILLSLDAITNSAVSVVAEISIPISFSLIYSCDFKKINCCYVQSEAFNQCSKFINKHLKNTEIIFSNSNIQTVRSFTKNQIKTVAAIIPTFISKQQKFQKYNVKDGLADYTNNTTRFWLIKKSAKNLDNLAENSKISIYCQFKRDEASSLYRILGIFNKYKFNLSMLASRPIPNKKWTYGFFIDFKVTNKRQMKNVPKLLKQMDKQPISYIILGAYKNIEQMSDLEKAKI